MSAQPEGSAAGMLLRPLFSLTLQLGSLHNVGALASGERRVALIHGGTLQGPGLEGEVITGSDCQLMRSDGVLDIDAAYVVRLASGAMLRIVNRGLRHGPPEVLARLAQGEAVDPHSYYFYTTMQFESGAAQLAWLNGTLALARAERHGGSVVFHAYAPA